jgi:hypothetical protein
VADFDGELYLRVVGEETILGARRGRQRPWDLPLLEPARALVAVGAISAARARAIIDDYSLAEAMRSDDRHGFHHRMAMAQVSRGRRPRARALKPRRVVPCDRTIEAANGALHVRHVTLSEDTTSVAITWRPNNSGRSGSRRRGHMVMMGHGAGGPLQPQLTDDRGTTVATGFSGGGSDDEWEGRLTAQQPVAADTAWIEIDGHRLELSGAAVACEITIEALANDATGVRYLWRRLAIPDFHGPAEIEESIGALVAAGTLEPDDPALDEMRAVREAMPDHPGMHSSAPHGVRQLPEPWRSLLGRLAKQDGPEGTLTLSAVTPEFGGFSVAISCLESQPDGFGIEVDVAPGLGHGPPRHFESGQLAWWAADDRGNHHLGQIGSWSGSEDYCSGEVNFWPALRPTARSLSIMPTGETSRAVITFPLIWGDSGRRGEVEPA